MFIIKVLIGILSIIFSVKIGIDKANKYKNEYYFYLSLISFCDNYLLEMSYKKEEIKKFLNFKSSSADFDEFLRAFIKDNKLNYPKYVNLEEQNLISSLFNLIGKSSSNSQVELIKSYKTNFIKVADEKNKNYNKFYSVYLKLSFICGLALFIMVI